MKVIVDTLRGRVNYKQVLYITCILGAAKKCILLFISTPIFVYVEKAAALCTVLASGRL